MKNDLWAKVLMVLAIQLSMALLWFFAGWPKFFDQSYIASFEKGFANTFLPNLPGGMRLQVYFIGLIEMIAGILVVVSMVKREFISFEFRWMNLAFAVSAFCFLVLSFGLRLNNDFAGSANIFFYLGATAVFYILFNQFEKEGARWG